MGKFEKASPYFTELLSSLGLVLFSLHHTLLTRCNDERFGVHLRFILSRAQRFEGKVKLDRAAAN